jgi:hypothetical protein
MWLTFPFVGLDARDLNRKTVRKRRAVTAKEPVKGDAVFVADSFRRFGG